MGKYYRQALEYQSWASVRFNAETKQGWENHKAGQYGNNRVSKTGDNGSLDQIFFFAEIAG